MRKSLPSENAQEAAEIVAIRGLAFLAQDPERLGRFLALTGIGPETLRSAAKDSGFLAGLLSYIAGDERVLLDFAEHTKLSPQTVEDAHFVLTGRHEQDTP